MINVVMCPANAKPYITQIENTLEAFQKAVGGYIEVFHLTEEVVVVCNEEGRCLGLPENKSTMISGFVGDCLICRTYEDEFISMDNHMLNFILSQSIARWNYEQI